MIVQVKRSRKSFVDVGQTFSTALRASTALQSCVWASFAVNLHFQVLPLAHCLLPICKHLWYYFGCPTAQIFNLFRWKLYKQLDVLEVVLNIINFICTPIRQVLKTFKGTFFLKSRIHKAAKLSTWTVCPSHMLHDLCSDAASSYFKKASN